MVKVSLVSLGCPKNLVDSDNLIARLRDENFIHTEDAQDADIVFVNTCGFIEAAKRESVEEILRLKSLKTQGKRLVVFGCLAQRYRDELLREIPEIDAIWGVGEEDRIIEYCRRTKTEGRRHRKTLEGPAVQVPSPAAALSYAYLKIAEGCNRGCTFCVIPSIRGPFRSHTPDSILRNAERHVRAGAKELILVAQDIASYGREYKDYNLARLIRDIASVSGDFWIRLLYVYPSAVTDELLTVVSDEEKVCKYLDIPLQHSEDRVLKAMGRPGSRAAYLKEIKKIRQSMPGITLRTTFIVGFPGETEDDFKGLREFIEEIRFERMGVFTYSREEGSAAYSLKGNVPKKIREKRRDELMGLQAHISLEKNRELLGKRFRALVDEADEDTAIARLCSQAPEIDGVVIIEQGQGSRIKGSRGKPESGIIKANAFVDVELTEAYDYDLKGILV